MNEFFILKPCRKYGICPPFFVFLSLINLVLRYMTFSSQDVVSPSPLMCSLSSKLNIEYKMRKVCVYKKKWNSEKRKETTPRSVKKSFNYCMGKFYTIKL